MSRVLLVTGTSRGLGKALSESFLQNGDVVLGCSRSKASIEHPNYEHHQLDITDEAAVASLFTALRRKHKHVDGLINNAGVASMNAFALSPMSSFDKIFNTNVRATVQFCQRALPLLRRSKNPRIVNFSTIAVPMNLAGESLYAASKSAVETLTRIIAKEYGSYGITCNALGPSPIQTALIAGVSEAKIAEIVQQQAIPEIATEQDVINTVDFFLRPQSKMITGQILYLGGLG